MSNSINLKYINETINTYINSIQNNDLKTKCPTGKVNNANVKCNPDSTIEESNKGKEYGFNYYFDYKYQFDNIKNIFNFQLEIGDDDIITYENFALINGNTNAIWQSNFIIDSTFKIKYAAYTPSYSYCIWWDLLTEDCEEKVKIPSYYALGPTNIDENPEIQVEGLTALINYVFNISNILPHDLEVTFIKTIYTSEVSETENIYVYNFEFSVNSDDVKYDKYKSSDDEYFKNDDNENIINDVFDNILTNDQLNDYWETLSSEVFNIILKPNFITFTVDELNTTANVDVQITDNYNLLTIKNTSDKNENQFAYITFKQSDVYPMNIICVGGGGGGGAGYSKVQSPNDDPKLRVDCGRGGGGGGAYFINNVVLVAGTFTIKVGNGGKGGDYDGKDKSTGDGKDASSSSVELPDGLTVIESTGGKGGTMGPFENNDATEDGFVEIYGNKITEGSGGKGVGVTNKYNDDDEWESTTYISGYDSWSYNNSDAFNVPDELLSLVNNCKYSGGGGGCGPDLKQKIGSLPNENELPGGDAANKGKGGLSFGTNNTNINGQSTNSRGSGGGGAGFNYNYSEQKKSEAEFRYLGGDGGNGIVYIYFTKSN